MHGIHCWCPVSFLKKKWAPIFLLKNGVPHTTRYPEDITECWGSKRKKAWYILLVPGRLLEQMGTHIFFLKVGCITLPGTLKISRRVGDLRERKAWYIMPVPSRFLGNMGTHIFFLKRVLHTTRQLSGL